MPGIHNTRTRYHAHKEIDKAMKELKKGKDLKKEMRKDYIYSFQEAYSNSLVRVRGDEGTQQEKDKTNEKAIDMSNLSRRDYLHQHCEETKKKSKYGTLEGREECKFELCEYRNIPGNFMNMLIICTSGCYMRFHHDLETNDNDCWNKTQFNYQQLHGIIELGKPCIRKECPSGTISNILKYIGYKEITNMSKEEIDLFLIDDH